MKLFFNPFIALRWISIRSQVICLSFLA